MNSNGGYILFDCKGLDLSSASEQTKNGIYADAIRAKSLNKPVFAINCSYGNFPFSPVPVTVHVDNDGIVYASANTLQVAITSADVCTVTNLIS